MASVDAWQDDIYRYSRGDTYGITEVKENIKRLLSERHIRKNGSYRYSSSNNL